MTPKIKIEEATRRLKNISFGKIILLEYKFINANAKFKCLICEHEWNSHAGNVINGGRGCPKCSKIITGKKLALPYNLVYNRILKTGCKLLSTKYKNNMEKLDILYPCGHINNISFGNFIKRKISCRKCFKEKYYKHRYGLDDIVEILESNNLTFIEFEDEYKDGSSKIKYSCCFGHITIRDIKYIIKFPTCKKCKIDSRAKQERGIGWVEWNNGLRKISVLARTKLEKWVNETLEFYNYTCYISNETKNIDVHHIYSFKSIVETILSKYEIKTDDDCKKLNKENIEKIRDEIVELNNSFGFGVCLRRDIHVLFHSIFGHGNNTPEQFYEFVERIKSGEIKIPE